MGLQPSYPLDRKHPLDGTVTFAGLVNVCLRTVFGTKATRSAGFWPQAALEEPSVRWPLRALTSPDADWERRVR
jgi:hypothetical protein